MVLSMSYVDELPVDLAGTFGARARLTTYHSPDRFRAFLPFLGLLRSFLQSQSLKHK